MVYGRLSPSHIIISPNGGISLIGLGRNPWNNTPHFTSPEQAQQAFLDWRTDQWSLGALMVFLFTKTKPYQEQKNPFGAAKNAHITPYITAFQSDHPTLYPTLKKMLSRTLPRLAGKDIKFGVAGRNAMLAGVDTLADAVQVRVETEETETHT